MKYLGNTSHEKDLATKKYVDNSVANCVQSTGEEMRPTYNGVNLALYSDIETIVNEALGVIENGSY